MEVREFEAEADTLKAGRNPQPGPLPMEEGPGRTANLNHP